MIPNDKEGSKSSHLTGIVITGIFGVVIACVSGVFLLVSSLINNGFIAIGPSLQSGQPTVIVVTATSQIEIPTITQVASLPQPSATIQQPAVIPTDILPTYTPDPSCMTVTPFREMGNNGETKTYIRCPVGQVQYSLQVDDILDSIVLSCPSQPDKSISFSKNEARSKNELLNTFDSEVFRSEAGCKVKITITNNFAEMGYTVWQEVIAP